MTDLRWNSIGILGSRALLSSLKHNNTILHIHLDGNSIPVDILDAFGKILAVFQDKIQARKAGGFEGVRVNSPFDLQKIISIPQNLSILLFESLTAIEDHCCPNESGCSYSMQVRSWGTSTERARNLLTPLQ